MSLHSESSPQTAQPLAPASPTSPSVFVDPGRRGLPEHLRPVALLLSVSVLLGGVLGVLWNLVVDLPTYVIDANSGASTTERGLTEFFGSDAWYVLFAAVGGLVIGVLTWWWTGRRGWLCVLLALGAALLAGLMCWGAGLALGPHDFDQRIAQARPGDRVEIDFALRSWTALLVWPMMAMVPILVGSSFGSEPEARGWRRRPVRTAPVLVAPAVASAQALDEPDQHRGEHQRRDQVGDPDRLQAEKPNAQSDQDHPTGH